MGTLAIVIELPPTGELETSGDGTSPSDAQTAEESLSRQKFLDLVSPYLEALPERPPRRAGNVSRVALLGEGVWSQLNRYLVLVTLDIGEGGDGIDTALSALLPEGSQVSVVGTYEQLQSWSKPEPVAQ
jgi:hypothetical protein